MWRFKLYQKCIIDLSISTPTAQANVDKDQVKEIERMIMEKSRAEYLTRNKFKPQVSHKESSTSSTAEPSSSGARPSGSETKRDEANEQQGLQVPSSVQIVLSMGFSYLQATEAYSIFVDDVDSMVCYLVEIGGSSRCKGKSTEWMKSQTLRD